MKKFLIWGIMAAGLLSASCTKEIVTVYVPADDMQEQKISIALSSGKDVLTTRAGRPLLSQAAGQNIQNVTLYFVNQTTTDVVLIKKIDKSEWQNAYDYDYGKKLEITLRKSDGEDLATGNYKVYAVGYSDGLTAGTSDAYTFNPIAKDSKWSDEAFYATLNASQDVEEIFAGVASLYAKSTDTERYLTKEEGDATPQTPAVILNRQVAGITGYVTNIPASVNNKVPASIRLIASKKFIQLNFTNLYGDETVNNTTKTYIVNGSELSQDTKVNYYNSSNQGFEVYTMDLSDWFKFGGSTGRTTFADCDLNGDGVVGWLDALCHVYGKSGADGQDADNFDTTNWADDIKGENGHNALSDFWTNPNEYQSLVAGSLFAGRFVIPFTYENGINTLELQLLDADGVIINHWNVSVPEDELTTAQTPVTPTGTVTYPDQSTLVYNIYRNHMYSLGTKGLDYSPDDPDEPTPDPDPDPKPEPDPDPDDPDEPQDLKSQTNLFIHVNDQWEIIHNMEID